MMSIQEKSEMTPKSQYSSFLEVGVEVGENPLLLAMGLFGIIHLTTCYITIHDSARAVHLEVLSEGIKRHSIPTTQPSSANQKRLIV